jgi:nickel-dependent lactate racemase
MSLFCAVGGERQRITCHALQELLAQALERLGPCKRVLVVPPDHTRMHSGAGELSHYIWDYYQERMQAILPALGTHAPMTQYQIRQMFGDIPQDLFHVHNWRTDVETVGAVPADVVFAESEGKVNYDWPVQLNRMVLHGGFDLVLSIGQVVPHEVLGMANYNKNILIGIGGRESINRSHFLGAAYGMERIMGRVDNPVRNVLNYAADRFLGGIPVVYVLTVVANDSDGNFITKGMFIGDDAECFRLAAELSLKVNFQLLDSRLQKVVAYLNPTEFRSTWLGNKAVYRTRMAIADGGQLIVLAPGVERFGEDADIDRLIRKYGYRGTESTLEAVAHHPDLTADLSAAAHLIHGSSDGRFKITWCPGGMSRQEVEDAGFAYDDCTLLSEKYNPTELQQGFNSVDGEEIFFVSNPALGLWAHKDRFLKMQSEQKETSKLSAVESGF